jgi:hypothetical protein
MKAKAFHSLADKFSMDKITSTALNGMQRASSKISEVAQKVSQGGAASAEPMVEAAQAEVEFAANAKVAKVGKDLGEKALDVVA